MELRNLEKNILYRLCEELTSTNPCGPVDAGVIYRSYADLPREKVAAGIQALVARGWLRERQGHAELILTDRGRSEIRTFLPAHLRPACDPPEGC